MVFHWTRASKLWAALVLSVSVVACGGGESPLKSAEVPPIAPGADTVNRDDLLANVKDLTVRERTAAVADVASALKHDLPPPTAEQRKRLAVGAEGRARQIALPLVVPSVRSSAGFVDRLRWYTNPWGGQTATLQFSSAGAQGLRIGLLVEKLPDAAVVRVFGPQDATEHVYSGQQINALLALNLSKDGPGAESSIWWAPLVEGERVVLALDLPPGETPSSLRVSVPKLSYFVESPRQLAGGNAAKLSPGSSGSCNIDATCYSSWSNERKATAHMVFQSGDGGYVCTGTLLNDAASSGTPYFLTAYHCISQQTEASSLQTHWFAESSACNASSTSSAYTVRSGGAQLLQASQSTDTSFMRLNSAPPPGVYFAGWHAGTPRVGWSLTGIHHPGGDLKKISFGAVASFSECTTLSGDSGFSCSVSNSSSGRFVGVRWSSGVTEGGSSGSSVWATIPGASSPRIIGQLYGGGSKCSAPSKLDQYGRLDLAYEAGLKTWLGAAPPSPSPTPSPTPSGTSDPENGWWWNASESGRGFAIEKRGNVIYLAGFMYTVLGRDVWYSGAFTQSAVGQFSGELREYQGGNDRVLSSVLQGPTSSVQVATARLFFSSSNAGVLQVTADGVTQSIALTRFSFGSGAASNASFESGWWWDPSDSGHGYFLEVQGSSLFGAVYTYYRSGGMAGWYTLQGALSGPTSFQDVDAGWLENGQSLMGAYFQPEGPYSSATASFTATSSTTGVLTFRNSQGNVVVNLQRFVF